jgi:hypothetical protein
MAYFASSWAKTIFPIHLVNTSKRIGYFALKCYHPWVTTHARFKAKYPMRFDVLTK